MENVLPGRATALALLLLFLGISAVHVAVFYPSQKAQLGPQDTPLDSQSTISNQSTASSSSTGTISTQSTVRSSTTAISSQSTVSSSSTQSISSQSTVSSSSTSAVSSQSTVSSSTVISSQSTVSPSSSVISSQSSVPSSSTVISSQSTVSSSSTSAVSSRSIVPTASWTLLFYMGADNNLQSVAIGDLNNQIEAVGSSLQVNVIVLFDGNTNDAVLYKVNPSSLTTIADLGPTNTGDPGTLKSFIDYSATNFPANHYALVLYDHGGGYQGVISDDHYHSSLTMGGLTTALSQAGLHFDIIVFHACLMAMVEVAYQIRTYGSYMVGSEEVTYNNIFHYDLLLRELEKDPQMSAFNLANEFVKDYSTDSGTSPATISAIDLTKLSSLASSVSTFTAALRNDLPTFETQVQTARTHSESYAFPYYVDLYDFAYLIWQDPTIADPSLKSASSQVLQTVSNAVISSWQRSHYSSHGLSIYFDSSIDSYNAQARDYGNLNFVQQTGWNLFVQTYLTASGSQAPASSSASISESEKSSV